MKKYKTAEVVKETAIVYNILSGAKPGNELFMKRKEVSEYLDITMDTLRNWEINGLLTSRRKLRCRRNSGGYYGEQSI